ncbi:uncharacterized protein [Dysidea avara]|uniref:uncharacterized protein n=1 Tax=Dysidea avara TaxID=196820 RepID=UPI00332B00DD
MAVPPSDVSGEVDTEAELSALAACFDKLTWALPLNDITPKLIAKRVMTIPDKQEIATMSSDKQKVTYFLEKCIQKPLSCGDRKNFDHLMDIMRQNRKAAFLVEELEKELAPPPAEPITNMKLIRIIVVPQLTAHWEIVATALKFTPSDIDTIAQSHNGDQRNCCIELLEQWIDSNSDKGLRPSTWPVLLKAITGVGLTGEADMIKKSLEKENVI